MHGNSLFEVVSFNLKYKFMRKLITFKKYTLFFFVYIFILFYIRILNVNQYIQLRSPKHNFILPWTSATRWNLDNNLFKNEMLLSAFLMKIININLSFLLILIFVLMINKCKYYFQNNECFSLILFSILLFIQMAVCFIFFPFEIDFINL